MVNIETRVFLGMELADSIGREKLQADEEL